MFNKLVKFTKQVEVCFYVPCFTTVSTNSFILKVYNPKAHGKIRYTTNAFEIKFT